MCFYTTYALKLSTSLMSIASVFDLFSFFLYRHDHYSPHIRPIVVTFLHHSHTLRHFTGRHSARYYLFPGWKAARDYASCIKTPTAPVRSLQDTNRRPFSHSKTVSTLWTGRQVSIRTYRLAQIYIGGPAILLVTLHGNFLRHVATVKVG